MPWAACDGIPETGCETNLRTTSNCGACGVPCSFANATATCATGVCTFGNCFPGYSDCDADLDNGCEVDHGLYSNSCATASNVGSACGDLNIGFGCPSTSFFTFATRTNRDSRWFRARADECASCSASVRHRIQLAVPAGVNYDLYAYSACGNEWSNSTNGTGLDESLTLTRSDNAANDDSFNYWIEVRWVGGASCSNWSLTFEGRQ